MSDPPGVPVLGEKNADRLFEVAETLNDRYGLETNQYGADLRQVLST